MGLEKAGLTLGKEIMAWARNGKSLLATRPVKVNIDGLKLAHQLEEDVLHISQNLPNFSELTYEEAIAMLNKTCKINLFSFANQTVNMEINGSKVVGKWLGGGGSKCAYKVNINNDEVCVLLPHSDWMNALREPGNTQKLKELGLVTNDYCHIIPIKVEGQTIPALISKPYDKHSFKIFDKKNPNDCLDKYLDLDMVNEENLPKLCSEMLNDIKILANNKVELHHDSFNIALKDGKLRLYLNDLPYEKLQNASLDSEKLKKRYLQEMLSSLGSAFSWGAESKNKTVKKLLDYRGVNDLVEQFSKL